MNLKKLIFTYNSDWREYTGTSLVVNDARISNEVDISLGTS